MDKLPVDNFASLKNYDTTLNSDSNEESKSIEYCTDSSYESIESDSKVSLKLECLEEVNSSTVLESENAVNESRLNILKKHFTKKLIFLILEEDFEYGFETKADFLVKEQMYLNSLATKEWLNQIFVNFFSDSIITLGLLRIISVFNYSDITPTGPTMALAALSHKNLEVKECAVRAFENWATVDSLEALKPLDISADWLREYVNDVIEDIERKHNVNTSAKNK